MLCTGCQLRLHLDVEVNRDGGGELAMAVAADDELLQRAQDAGADPLGDLVAAGQALEGDRWGVRDATDEEGTRTVTLRTAFDDPADLEALAAQLTQALSADEVVLLERLEVSVTQDQVQVAATAGADLRAAVRDYGLSPRKAERLLRERSALAYGVTVTPPGEILTASAGGISAGDGPPTWTIAPGETVDIELTSTRPRRPILAIVAGIVGLLLAAAFVARVVVVRRRTVARRERRPLAG